MPPETKTLPWLESEVLQYALLHPDLARHRRADAVRVDALMIAERVLTAVGFITSFERTEASRLFTAGFSSRWGKLLGRINLAVDVDFVVYIDDGCLTALEGCTFGGEPWPVTITEFEVRAADAQ